MANPLFEAMHGATAGLPANLAPMMQKLQQFRQSFSGDPKAQVQQLLNSGRVTQAQYDRAVQVANALQRMMR